MTGRFRLGRALLLAGAVLALLAAAPKVLERGSSNDIWNLAFAVALVLSRRLDEPEAASLEELLREILIQSPQRFWLRLWPRG